MSSSTQLVVSKRRKDKTPLTLDEVFNTVSFVRSSSLLVDDETDVTLTPRSAKACTNLGINPEVLKIRELESFWEGNLDPEIIRIRHSAYVERRHDLMRKCVAERKRVLNQEAQMMTTMVKTLDDGEKPREMTAAQLILEQEKAKNSEMIRIEMKKLRKIKQRQEKELQQMVAFEIKQQEIQKEMQARVEEEKRKEMLEKKAHDKRFKLMLEEKRLQEAHRAVIDQMTEMENQKKAQEMHEKDRKIAEERERKFQEQRRLLRIECERKFQEHEESKRKLQQFFIDEQIRLRTKLETINLAEQRKQEVLQERNRLQVEANRKKRELLEKRITKNRQVANYIEYKKKEDINIKNQKYEEKRAMTLAEQEEERRLHQQEVEMREQRRQQILFEKEQNGIVETQRLLQKLDEEEYLAEQARAERLRENLLLKEKRNVRKQLKEDNKNRVMKVQELKRREVMQRIEDQEHRINSIVSERQALIQSRRQQAAEARIQKEKILKVMDDMRAKSFRSTTGGSTASLLLTGGSSRSGPGGGLDSSSSVSLSNKQQLQRYNHSADSSMNGSSYELPPITTPPRSGSAARRRPINRDPQYM